MNREQLREALEDLHLKLLQLDTHDESLRQKRDVLITELSEALEQEDLGGYHFSLAERMKESTFSFDESHPAIAHIMKALANLLENAGI